MKAKNGIWVSPLAIIIMGLLCLAGWCKKEEPEPSGSITDKDGNVYTSVTIGTQVWLVEDLKTTKYQNGDPIPSGLSGSDWQATTSGALKNHPNNIYGNLYNGYAVNDSRKLCPTGYHVPSKTEWETLIIYLGGESVAGGKMKETGTTHWLSPNTDATNESGFTALPVGTTTGDDLSYLGNACTWWSSTKDEGYDSNQDFCVWSDKAGCFNGSHYWWTGFAIRCIKN